MKSTEHLTIWYIYIDMQSSSITGGMLRVEDFNIPLNYHRDASYKNIKNGFNWTCSF